MKTSNHLECGDDKPLFATKHPPSKYFSSKTPLTKRKRKKMLKLFYKHLYKNSERINFDLSEMPIFNFNNPQKPS